MKTRVLITGSNGLLGQKLIYALAPNPMVDLIATARKANRCALREGYRYIPMDIENVQELENVFLGIKPDVVIHTAAMTHVDQCELNPEQCYSLNVKAVESIVQICKELQIHLVHLSTDFIFSGEHGPLTEDETPNPLSIYGHSKLKAEQIVMTGLENYTILRTVLVYGLADDMSRTNIVLWAKESLEQRKPINVVNDQFRTPTLAEDLAQGCILAALKRVNGVFNISGKEFLSISDFVYRIAEFWNLDTSLITQINSLSLAQPAKRPPITGFVISKANEVLGYQPHTLEEGFSLIQNQLNSRVK